MKMSFNQWRNTNNAATTTADNTLISSRDRNRWKTERNKELQCGCVTK